MKYLGKCGFISALIVSKMDAVNFEDLSKNFLAKLNVVKTLLEVRDFAEDDSCSQHMEVNTPESPDRPKVFYF